MKRAILLGVALVAAGLTIALKAPISSSLALTFFLGRSMLKAHALPTVLGTQSFTAPAAPWFAEGWLGAAITSLLYGAGGYVALVVASVIAAALALVLVESRCRARGLGAAVTALTLGGVILMSTAILHVGGGVADLLFAAAFLRLLDRLPTAAAWWALPLVIVWANTSTAGFLAPALALLSLLGLVAQERGLGERARATLPFTLAVCAAVVATPAALHPLAHYALYLNLDHDRAPRAWQPIRVAPVAFLAGFVPLLVIAAWLGLRRAKNGADVAVALGAVALVLLHGKYLGMASIALAPVVATAFERARLGGSSPAVPRLPRITAAIAAWILMLALACGLVAHARGTRAFDAGLDQRVAIDRLAGDGREHRLFCVNVAWCNYALLRNAPSIRVFIDGREPAYPAQVVSDALAITRGRPVWKQLVRTWQIDTFLAADDSVTGTLLRLMGWREIPISEHFWILERPR